MPEYLLSGKGASRKREYRGPPQKAKHYICHICLQTFSASKGTLFYRLRTEPKTVLLVIALLVYGCPIQAIVQAFGLDERTVLNWVAAGGATLSSLP